MIKTFNEFEKINEDDSSNDINKKIKDLKLKKYYLEQEIIDLKTQIITINKEIEELNK